MHKHLAVASLLLLPTIAACAPADSSTGEDADSEGDELKVCAKGATVKGIDVSKWQGHIDWAKVKSAGIKFAIVRVGDGDSYVDNLFGENWAGTKAHGIIRGTYQFFRPSDDPIKAADLFVKQIKAHGGMQDGDLPPVLDVEVQEGVSDATLRSRALTWLQHVEAALGRRPMIYTSPGFWNAVGADSSFAKYPLWVAHWETACPTMPSSWSGWRFWQHADDGKVSGISGDVDLDVWNGTLAELQAFAGGGSQPPPPPADTASLGGTLAFDPAVGRNPDGRLELFGVGPKGNMLTAFQTEPNGKWSEWYSLGGNLQGRPASANDKDGRLEVFARDAGGKMVHAHQDAPNGKIGAFATLGSSTWAGDPAVGKNSDGRLELFAVSADGALHHVFQTAPNGGWSSWASLGKAGGGLREPAVVRGEDGKLRVFALGKDEATYMIAQQSGGWSAWKSLGGVAKSAPAVIKSGSGQLGLFARGSDGALWHKWENSPGGSWSDWYSLGGGVHDPVAATDTDGRMEVFVRGNNDALYRTRQKKAGGTWEGFTKMGGNMAGKPTAARNEDGRLEVFYRDDDGSVHHVWQKAPMEW